MPEPKPPPVKAAPITLDAVKQTMMDCLRQWGKEHLSELVQEVVRADDVQPSTVLMQKHRVDGLAMSLRASNAEIDVLKDRVRVLEDQVTRCLEHLANAREAYRKLTNNAKGVK